MELTPKELAYLELYKGKNSGLEVIRPDIKPDMRWFYELDYGYKNVNSLLSFIYSKNPELMKHITPLPNIGELVDMTFTLSDVACRYAIEHPFPDYHLYRMEHKNNLNNYLEGGMTTSFKSTSKSKSEVEVFDYPNHVGLSFDTDGFVPYIDVDRIVTGTVFNDEKEILFPPCIGGSFSGFKEDVYGKEFSNVVLDDEYKDGVDLDYEELYQLAKSKFPSEFYECRNKGEVSDNLKAYCTVIGSYIYANLRKMYKQYYDMYKDKNFSR